VTSAPRARVDGLTHEGHGVARVDGKVTFIDGALPGEEVTYRCDRHRGRFDEAHVVDVIEPSPDRVEPRCPHFGTCGGCSLQHLASAAQVRVKQARLLADLAHIGRVEPDAVLDPVTGPVWGYRRKARLSVKYLRGRERLVLGFRERRSQRVAELRRCEVLDPPVGDRLEALRETLESLTVRARIPQVEVAAGDEDGALAVRHLDPLSPLDRERLQAFGEAHGLQVYSQPRGPESLQPLWPREPRPLAYRLAEWDVELGFRPTDFTQVNAVVNAGMVRLALSLLGAGAGDRVLDLYCGLGNFTLPLARLAGQVVGVEGDPALIERARDNVRRNGLENVALHVADLTHALPFGGWAYREPTGLLLDPPRSGADEVVRGLQAPLPDRIVYVSCNPESLARDAGVLVRAHGYRLARVGILDMFPHTAHVESIALFNR
jgi:23S rRNA (uracil1939-C5)-methyltransferase